MLLPLKVAFVALFFISGVLHPLSPVLAADAVIECPASITPELGDLSLDKEAWVAFVARPFPLTAAGFMQGDPSMRADLRPTSTKKTSAGRVVTWTFVGPYPHGKWLSCDYADGLVSLSRQIPDTASECSVTYRGSGKGRLSVGEIACK